jgi:hypothetical protein
VVARCVEILIGCYRKGEADNPEVYTTALAAILEGYPESVVRFVTDPRTGLPGRSNWLPTIAEARGACETAMKPIREEAERERRKRERGALPPPAKTWRPTREELMARYPDLIIGSAFDAKEYPANPPDYSARPCTLSAEALHALGIEPKVDPP